MCTYIQININYKIMSCGKNKYIELKCSVTMAYKLGGELIELKFWGPLNC